MKKKTTIALICLALLAGFGLGALTFASGSGAGEPAYYREDRNGITLVSLSGSWEEMGRQYGELLGGELRRIYNDLLIPPVKDDPEGQVKMLATAMTKYDDYPARLKAFFRGMAETSGLTEEQLIICNAMESIYTVRDEPKCSALAVWGDYAKDKLIYGRNYDYGELFRAFKDYVCVCVYHPADGSVPTATVGYMGEIYCVNGMNANGVFLELNNGSKSSAERHNERLTGLAQLFQLELDAPDLAYADEFFQTVGCSSSYIIGVADKNEVRIYEWCGLGVKMGLRDPAGLAVATNHFVNPDWELETPTDASAWLTITRRENLLALAEQYKGQIDAVAMEQLMSIPVEEGGAMSELTVYQIVAVPEERTLHIRVIGGADWTEFALGEVF